MVGGLFLLPCLQKCLWMPPCSVSPEAWWIAKTDTGLYFFNKKTRGSFLCTSNMQTEKGEKIINRNGPQLKRATAPCVSDSVVDANGGVWGVGENKDRELGRPSTWRYREVAPGALLACTSSGKPPSWLQ